MGEQKKYDVFISYSRKDFDEVDALVKHLRQAIPDLTYWFDFTGIESGDDFEDRIIAAIDESSFVLFALSENSMQSHWTKDEVMYAKNTGKKVLPVLLKGSELTDGWFLFKFGRVDCIDSTNNLQVAKLVRNLSEWTSKPIARHALHEVQKGTAGKLSKTENAWRQSAIFHASFSSWFKRLMLALVALMLVLFAVWLFWPRYGSSGAGNKPVKTLPMEATLGYGWVDLGLSVMWATCNLGAEAPYERGDYFVWGNPNRYIETTDNEDSVKDASTDDSYVLEPIDDVASLSLGKGWRMPTVEELNELREQCTWIWTNRHGMNGYQVVGMNGNSIFLPAAGSFNGDWISFDGLGGFYWSSNLSEDNSYCAQILAFNQREYVCGDNAFRLVHRSVRPVCSRKSAYKMMK